ncbi:hypothetical protein VTK73DRAFT_30 [Phialemonium thermophilum]|uniref:Uncharacterized protein n=1 Tax=Phialemonium thermophilum TaxID=223376 RepID=A0ABR3Y8R6_9PEZI
MSARSVFASCIYSYAAPFEEGNPCGQTPLFWIAAASRCSVLLIKLRASPARSCFYGKYCAKRRCRRRPDRIIILIAKFLVLNRSYHTNAITPPQRYRHTIVPKKEPLHLLFSRAYSCDT